MAAEFPSLQLPEASLQIRATDHGKREVLCMARKKWVALEPEEWVRQHVVAYLSDQLHYPLGCMSVEHRLMLNGMERRADVVCFTPDQTPRLLVECKAPNIPLNQEVVDQAARYNLVLQVPILLVTNGMQHAAFEVRVDGTSRQIKELPSCPSKN